MPVWGSGEGACTAPPTLPRDLRWGVTPPPAKGHPPSTHAYGHTAQPAHNPRGPGGRSEPRLHADEGDNKVWLSETDYTLYVTFHLRNTRNGTETNVLALYGTTTWPSCLPGETGQAPRGPLL